MNNEKLKQQDIFEALFNYAPDKRWSLETLKEKNEAEQQRLKEKNFRRIAKEKEKAEREATRRKTAEERGKAEAYNEKSFSETDWTLRSLARFIVKSKESYKDELEKFNEKAAKDPVYAFTWADDLFKTGAQYQVAKNIQQLFEEGFSKEEMLKEAHRTFFQNARYVSSSTSQCRNLTEQYLTSAYAQVVEILEEKE